jgi:para-nitrobenzyl esterase
VESEESTVRRTIGLLIMSLVTWSPFAPASSVEAPAAETIAGIVAGDYASGISVFRGIPFAAAPVNALRWRAPRPAAPWDGVREAKDFGPRCMQLAVFGDMNFRSDGMDEDCLYLNIWTPDLSHTAKLPVLVYFFGGGFVAGDGSEPRYDGESMARKGIVAITVNYRLGVFGFMAHPELSSESGYGGSGNYGLLDQVAALRWVRDNIAAFGGDPERVTIAGESAGSASVSGLVMSPLSAGLFAGAIGESGSFLGALRAQDAAATEALGLEFARHVGAQNLDELRTIPAQQLLEATAKDGVDKLDYGRLFSFPVSVDGYYFPESPNALYESGQVADVPLMIGWNSQEMSFRFLFGEPPLSTETFKAKLDERFGPFADEAYKLYEGTTPATLEQAATDLAGDLFIAYSTWKWGDAHSRVTSKPVYRYYYRRPRPAMRPEFANAIPGLAGGISENSSQAAPPAPLDEGAVHSAEIEYAMGNLPTNRVYDWQPEDYKVSAVLQGYFANFIKTGDPNGLGLPAWPAMNSSKDRPIAIIDVDTHARPAAHRDRYLLLDRMNGTN